MRLTYLGHSGIRLTTTAGEVVIDPFLSGNPVAPFGPDVLSPSYIILTHAHGDHVGDSEAIAKRTGAKVISNYEIVTYFGARKVDGHPMNSGGPYGFPFGRLRFTPAWHSSSFPDGTYGGMPMGLVLEADDVTLYHAGDTALFSDMQLIGRLGLDLALLPIGGNFTMDPEDAIEAVKLLRPKRVLPIHYNTFDLIKQDATAFGRRVEAETDAVCIVLSPGDSLDL